MSLPASEINFWKDFYAVYPFPQDRDNERHAELIATLIELVSMAVQHKYFKRGPKMSELTPDYLGERKQNSTDPQQRAEYQEFKMKLNAVQGKA